MEDLPALLEQIQPVGDYLAESFSKLPDATLAEEQGRLRERFLDIGGRLIAISEAREAE